jgi:hypothetical protein
MSAPWWLAFPGRLEFELDALRKVCSEIDIFTQASSYAFQNRLASAATEMNQAIT